MVGVVESEAGEGLEVAFDPVQPQRVGGHVGEFDIVGPSPHPDPLVLLGSTRCGLKLSIAIPMRTSGGYNERGCQQDPRKVVRSLVRLDMPVHGVRTEIGRRDRA